MNQAIYNFYTSDGEDNCGRQFDDIVGWFDDEQLERVHDYVQWIFPTLTPSQCQKFTPNLDEETIEALKASPEFHARFVRAIARILSFWGIEYEQDGPSFKLKPITTVTVLSGPDHNQLRVARFMESCRLLGYADLAKHMFDTLVIHSRTEEGQSIHAVNLAYWYKAAYGTIELP